MKDSVRDKIKTVLVHRNAFLVAALLGFIVALPSLTSGMLLDDYSQRTKMLTQPDYNPFEFYRMDSPRSQAQVESGVLPWWIHPSAKLVFFRPIARWLMQLDYTLWPDNVPLMHLHSIAWYTLLVLSAGLVYKRLMPLPMAAGLAAMMFAVDAGHGAATSWLANRNVLVAMTGSMLALLCYRRAQWYWQLLGCALFALTLACAEAAIAITGYFFAYEICLSQRRWWIRIARLAPYGLIVLLYLAFWHRYGYGSAGPGFYTDPASDPLAFIQAVIFRAPSLLFGQLASIPVELFAFIEKSPLRSYTLIIVLLICAALVKLLWPLLRESAFARFYALGMCIAVIPICGVTMVSRSLFYVSFGAIGLLSLWFERFLSGAITPKRIAAVCTSVLLVLHFVISPIAFVVDSKVVTYLDSYLDTRAVHLPDEDGVSKKILAISENNYELHVYFPRLKNQSLSLGANPTRPPPSIVKVRALESGIGQFELSREDDDTLLVHKDSGFDGMRHGKKYGFSKGETVDLDDVTITVREVNADHAATDIEYRFKPGVLNEYEVVAWTGKYFIPAQLPAKGTKTLVTVRPPFS